MKIKKYINLKDFYSFLSGLYTKRRIITQLVKNDLRKQNLGSFLGIAWTFIHPLVFTFVIWLVFSVGMRGGRPMDGFPFVLWFVTGMFVWFFFSAGLSSGASSILGSGYLVQKMVFRVSMLPVVKILSAFIIHCFFLLFLLILFLIHGHMPDVYFLQIFYYLFCTLVLCLGISWITSSVVLFFRDLEQIIQIIVRVGFWLTPIFWKVESIPKKWRFIFLANPVHYLVTGYRDSLLYKNWFWERPYLTLYFWGLTLVIFALGSILFRRLKPHFADVI
jgi:lipopolysaccharide transport system permease protein/teichoic acid transport system permease protein